MRTLGRVIVLILACTLVLGVCPRSAASQRSRGSPDRYDDTFRKYSKRFFGSDFDWRVFKAQGLAESNLDSNATSRVGARGVMQLMPSTFGEIASKNPDFGKHIDDPEWNIAAGISYDRRLWNAWGQDSVGQHQREFMFASYNAGRRTILGAQLTARNAKLDARSWPSIESVAPEVPRWRYKETLGYVKTIGSNLATLDDKGRTGRRPTTRTQ